ncbi:hypothetical protein HAX54_019709 [Datura stramonium]|uniref:Uncharacterized protein n=1 Tax=Datura stramonium TaxID=4076 RepID=A0ABS8Y755_DATST|nr:hypothetical protein [Datura stramonium]
MKKSRRWHEVKRRWHEGKRRWHGQRKMQSACRQWHDSGIAAGKCGWATRQWCGRGLGTKDKQLEPRLSAAGVGVHGFSRARAYRPTHSTGSWAVSLCTCAMYDFVYLGRDKCRQAIGCKWARLACVYK